MTNNPEGYPIVEVEWIDSTTPSEPGWVSLEEKIGDEGEYCVRVFSAGYLVRETPEEAWVVSSYYSDRAGDIGIQGLIVIPKVSIIKIDRSDET